MIATVYIEDMFSVLLVQETKGCVTSKLNVSSDWLQVPTNHSCLKVLK